MNLFNKIKDLFQKEKKSIIDWDSKEMLMIKENFFASLPSDFHYDTNNEKDVEILEDELQQYRDRLWELKAQTPVENKEIYFIRASIDEMERCLVEYKNNKK